MLCRCLRNRKKSLPVDIGTNSYRRYSRQGLLSKQCICEDWAEGMVLKDRVEGHDVRQCKEVSRARSLIDRELAFLIFHWCPCKSGFRTHTDTKTHECTKLLQDIASCLHGICIHDLFYPKSSLDYL